MAGAIRVVAGRKSIQSNLGDALKTRNHSLDHLFSSKTLNIEIKRNKCESDSEDSEGEIHEEKSYIEKVGVSGFALLEFYLMVSNFFCFK